LAGCGGIKVYIDGQLQGSLYAYQRYTEECAYLNLNLKQGENIIYVQVNNLAERDTQIYFKLKYCGDAPLSASLPVNIDHERMTMAKRLLDGLYLEKFNYTDKDIYLCLQDMPKEEWTITVEMNFTNPHIKLAKKERRFDLKPGETRFYIGDLIYTSAGAVMLTISCVVDGIQLHRKLQFEYYDETIPQSMEDSGIKCRKRNTLVFIAEHGVPNFQTALAILEAGGDSGSALEIMDSELVRVHDRLDCSDFRTPAFFYALKSEKVPEMYKQKLIDALLGYRYWFDENGNDVMWFFSENHALNFHATEFLAGEYMPEAVFTNSGMTGKQHKEKAKVLLRKWFENFFKYGLSEWNSAVYIPINVIGLTALYDMAKDMEIKTNAKRALDELFTILAKNSYKGIVSASYGRTYFKNLIGMRTSGSSFLNYIVSGEGYLNEHSFASVLLALSDYEPSSGILKLYTANSYGQESYSVQGEMHVSLYSYKTLDFIMASALDYNPGKPGVQEHVFHAMILDCDTQIWINHPGEAVYFGEGRPSYFAGNGTLPLVEQKHGHAKITYDILDQEVDYTHAFCPLNNFDEIQQEKKWIFLRKEHVKIAIYAENGLEITTSGPLRNYEIISKGRKNTWHVFISNEADGLMLRQYAQNYICGGVL